jgi:hypothetical protein
VTRFIGQVHFFLGGRTDPFNQERDVKEMNAKDCFNFKLSEKFIDVQEGSKCSIVRENLLDQVVLKRWN